MEAIERARLVEECCLHCMHWRPRRERSEAGVQLVGGVCGVAERAEQMHREMAGATHMPEDTITQPDWWCESYKRG